MFLMGHPVVPQWSTYPEGEQVLAWRKRRTLLWRETQWMLRQTGMGGLPRSRVIPLSLLWGFLSNEAVEATELRALAATGRVDLYNYGHTRHTYFTTHCIIRIRIYLRRFCHCQYGLVFPHWNWGSLFLLFQPCCKLLFIRHTHTMTS